MKKNIWLMVPLLLFVMVGLSFAGVHYDVDNHLKIKLIKAQIKNEDQHIISTLTHEHIEIIPLIFHLKQPEPVFQNGQVDFFLVNGKDKRITMTKSSS